MRTENEMVALVQALVVTAEAIGHEMRPVAAALMAKDLDGYQMKDVERALTTCRRELRGKLCLADILDRITGVDGRPGSDEAWAMSLEARDERATVVWSEEMAKAWDVALPVLEMGDKVGARMAFRDAYDRFVSDARAEHTQPKWSVSLGHDVEGRRIALGKAVERGVLSHDKATTFLPPADNIGVVAYITGNSETLLLECDDKEPEGLRAHLDSLRAIMAEPSESPSDRRDREAVEYAKKMEQRKIVLARQVKDLQKRGA